MELILTGSASVDRKTHPSASQRAETRARMSSSRRALELLLRRRGPRLEAGPPPGPRCLDFTRMRARSASAAFRSYRKSPCCACSIWAKKAAAARSPRWRKSVDAGPFAGPRRECHVALRSIGKIRSRASPSFPKEGAAEYLKGYDLRGSRSGTSSQRATYSLFGLMSFLATGEAEVRAWMIP